MSLLEQCPIIIQNIILENKDGIEKREFRELFLRWKTITNFKKCIGQIDSNFINMRLRHITDHPVYVVGWQSRYSWRPDSNRFAHLNHH
jgi:hypothetical protein